MNINAFKKFTKGDIKVGYVVKMKDDQLFMVMQTANEMVLVDNDGCWVSFSKIGDDFRLQRHSEISIEEVYGYAIWRHDALTVSTNGRNLLWKREDPAKKMTVEEIEKALGYKVEIVS